MEAWLISHYSIFLWVLGLAFSLWFAHRLLLVRQSMGTEAKLPRQVIMLALSIIALIILILEMPMSETSRGQLLSLIGVVVTGVIAISSTTFVANALGGLMLRVIASFQPGDFVRAGDHFGRVTDRGLFHTEIQTEDRDLTTLPNLFLITNPVTVVHSSGTMISSGLSLGYDIPRTQVETLLQDAAELAGLEDPFVFVSDLGDFSVSYKVYGFLVEVRQLLSAKSNLRKHILDVLHQNHIEIVSPSFMNQRQLVSGQSMIPEPKIAATQSPQEQIKPEDLIFDKAEKAAELEVLRKELAGLKAVEEKGNEAGVEINREKIKAQKTELKVGIEELAKELKEGPEE